MTISSASFKARPPKHPSTPIRHNKSLSASNVVVPSTSTYGAVHAAPLRHPKPAPPSTPSSQHAASESQPLCQPLPPVIAASTSFFFPHSLSANNLRPAMGLHPAPPGHIDWLSLIVVYWVTLVSEASRGLMLPSTWPFFASLGGSKQLLGVFVASFSMGRMATTIPLGYLSDRHSTSTVLCVASVIQVLGHLMYALSASLPMLFFSRIFVGFGSATMSVCRAHVTRAIPATIRTHHFAYLSALQFVGFAVLPGFGGLLARLPEYNPLPFMPFNGYTYPAYLLVLCNVISVAVVYMFYYDPPANPVRLQDPSSDWQSDQDDDASSRPDAFALLVCLLVNVVFRGVVAEFETISTPFLMEQYALDYAAASYQISVIGFCGFFVYLSFKPIAKRFSDRSLVFTGLLLVLLGCLPLAIVPLTPHISLTGYVICLGMTWSLAYPLGQTAVLALFSKVLGGLPAGGFLGLFSATGSLSRVTFAMVAGVIWSNFGRESVFAVILAYICMASTLVLVSFKKLIPLCES